MRQPLKRHEALKPLSKDHHHGLLLCWKIRAGRKNNIETERIRAYTDFFFESQLKPHFKFEEEEIFNLLGDDHPLVKKAKHEHARLEQLFSANTCVDRALADIEKELDAHIRFEERVLFTELQAEVSEAQLDDLKNKEDEMETPDPDDWQDKFWLKTTASASA
ncbi:MAG: hemerythrin domain-containing protein [Salinimicrobium sp.]